MAGVTLCERHGISSAPSALHVKWGAVRGDLVTLGASAQQMDELEQSLCAILSLLEVRDPDSTTIAATAFDVDPMVAHRAFCVRELRVGGEIIESSCEEGEVQLNAGSLARTLYHSVFDRVVAIVNTAFRLEALEDVRSISILDIFGFEMFEQNGFEQLCINYANEHMQYLFLNGVVMMRHREYEQEGITGFHETGFINESILQAFDCVPGIISLVDEECRLPSGSVENLTHKVCSLSTSCTMAPRIRASMRPSS